MRRKKVCPANILNAREYRVYVAMRTRAAEAVKSAIDQSILPRLFKWRDGMAGGPDFRRQPLGIKCHDCSAPAIFYDHRDYYLPLEVEPVCQECNVRRGPAWLTVFRLRWEKKKGNSPSKLALKQIEKLEKS